MDMRWNQVLKSSVIAFVRMLHISAASPFFLARDIFEYSFSTFLYHRPSPFLPSISTETDSLTMSLASFCGLEGDIFSSTDLTRWIKSTTTFNENSEMSNPIYLTLVGKEEDALRLVGLRSTIGSTIESKVALSRGLEIFEASKSTFEIQQD